MIYIRFYLLIHIIHGKIRNMKKAHILDGIALTKFLFWAKNIKIKKLTEIDIIKKLEIFRAIQASLTEYLV